MPITNWQLGTNDFFKDESISSVTQASGWNAKAGPKDSLPVILWAYVTSGQRGGDLGRIVGLVDDKGQLRPADKVDQFQGYVRDGSGEVFVA
ncbi:MAG: hypothetical protein WA695_01310 [Candidatus Dormiibacterota bacterium]